MAIADLGETDTHARGNLELCCCFLSQLLHVMGLIEHIGMWTHEVTNHLVDNVAISWATTVLNEESDCPPFWRRTMSTQWDFDSCEMFVFSQK